MSLALARAPLGGCGGFLRRPHVLHASDAPRGGGGRKGEAEAAGPRLRRSSGARRERASVRVRCGACLGLVIRTMMPCPVAPAWTHRSIPLFGFGSVCFRLILIYSPSHNTIDSNKSVKISRLFTSCRGWLHDGQKTLRFGGSEEDRHFTTLVEKTENHHGFLAVRFFLIL